MYLPSFFLVETVGWSRRVQLIGIPAQGVGLDIGPDLGQFGIVANDMLVVIAMPDRQAICTTHAVDAISYGRFVGTDNCPQ